MATIASGLVGGLLGSIVTGAGTRATIEEPTQAAVVWAMYLGDGDPAHYGPQGMVTHVLYGAVAGAVFLSFAGSLGLGLATVGGAVFWALVWSAILAIVAVGFWSTVVIGAALDARSLAGLVAGHLVYGVALGLWVALVPGI